MIKFKHGESDTIFYKVDTATGQKISFSSNAKPKTSGWGMNKEMQVWVAEGNTIEDQFTAEELAQKDADDQIQLLENQQQICKQNLKDTDYALLPDHEFPEDVPEIKLRRIEWKRIIKSSKIETIPDKPF
jgi:hypothetical protein